MHPIDYALDAFGRELSSPGGDDPNVPNDLIYQANWLTLSIGGQNVGLSRYRLYDAELGIFLSRDFLPYLNKYRAWSNNPVGQVDGDGLAAADEVTWAGRRGSETWEQYLKRHPGSIKVPEGKATAQKIDITDHWQDPRGIHYTVGKKKYFPYTGEVYNKQTKTYCAFRSTADFSLHASSATAM